MPFFPAAPKILHSYDSHFLLPFARELERNDQETSPYWFNIAYMYAMRIEKYFCSGLSFINNNNKNRKEWEKPKLLKKTKLIAVIFRLRMSRLLDFVDEAHR